MTDFNDQEREEPKPMTGLPLAIRIAKGGPLSTDSSSQRERFRLGYRNRVRVIEEEPVLDLVERLLEECRERFDGSNVHDGEIMVDVEALLRACGRLPEETTPTAEWFAAKRRESLLRVVSASPEPTDGALQAAFQAGCECEGTGFPSSFEEWRAEHSFGRSAEPTDRGGHGPLPVEGTTPSSTGTDAGTSRAGT